MGHHVDEKGPRALTAYVGNHGWDDGEEKKKAEMILGTAGFDEIADKSPQKLRELGEKAMGRVYDHRGVSMSIGRKNMGGAHIDTYHNLVMPLEGIRRIALAPPFVMNHFPGDMIGKKGGSIKVDGFSDQWRHKFMIITLNPGDALYIPPDWVHQVEGGVMACCSPMLGRRGRSEGGVVFCTYESVLGGGQRARLAFLKASLARS
jgi:hypothetical protein